MFLLYCGWPYFVRIKRIRKCLDGWIFTINWYLTFSFKSQKVNQSFRWLEHLQFISTKLLWFHHSPKMGHFSCKGFKWSYELGLRTTQTRRSKYHSLCIVVMRQTVGHETGDYFQSRLFSGDALKQRYSQSNNDRINWRVRIEVADALPAVDTAGRNESFDFQRDCLKKSMLQSDGI